MHRRSSAIAIVVVDIINKPTNAISSNSDRQPENVYVHNCYTKKSTVSFAKCNVTMLLLLLLLLLLCLLQHLLPVAVTVAVAVTAAVTIGHWLNTHFSFRCGKRVNSFLPNERRKCTTRDAAHRRHSNEINKKNKQLQRTKRTRICQLNPHPSKQPQRPNNNTKKLQSPNDQYDDETRRNCSRLRNKHFFYTLHKQNFFSLAQSAVVVFFFCTFFFLFFL